MEFLEKDKRYEKELEENIGIGTESYHTHAINYQSVYANRRKMK